MNNANAEMTRCWKAPMLFANLSDKWFVTRRHLPSDECDFEAREMACLLIGTLSCYYCSCCVTYSGFMMYGVIVREVRSQLQLCLLYKFMAFEIYT